MKKITQEMLNSMSLEELKKLNTSQLKGLVGLKIGEHTLTAFVASYFEPCGRKSKGFLTDKRGEKPHRWDNLITILIRNRNKTQTSIQPEQPVQPEQPDLPESDIHVVKASLIQKYIDIAESDDTENTALLVIPVKQSLIKVLDKIAEDNFIECVALARSAIISMVGECVQELEDENKKADSDLTSEDVDEGLELRRAKNREYYQKNKAKYAEYNLKYWAKQAKLIRENKEASK